MTTFEKITLENGKTIECECDWEFERNPFGKEPEHYDGHEDGWFLKEWTAHNSNLSRDEEIELDDELHRQGPST
jgi:hypothetical protein